MELLDKAAVNPDDDDLMRASIKPKQTYKREKQEADGQEEEAEEQQQQQQSGSTLKGKGGSCGAAKGSKQQRHQQRDVSMAVRRSKRIRRDVNRGDAAAAASADAGGRVTRRRQCRR